MSFWRNPDPASFLNPFNVDWQSNPDFAHWHLGDVISRPQDLMQAIWSAPARHHLYRDQQEARVAASLGDRTPGAAAPCRPCRHVVHAIMRIGFLFNHDANHQIPHTIQIAAALAAEGVDVEILTSSLEQRAVASAMLPATAAVRFTTLEVGSVSRVADRMLHHVAPFRRIAILRENLSAFARLDALVAPETTSTLLKTKFGLSSLKLIYVPHGAGDGAAGFQAATKNFDLVLLSGHKVRDRMLSLGLITQDGHAIVGYPKFDTVDLAARPRYFDNDKPTVLYNPHFNPLLSSWYTVGEKVLDWFAAQDELNLIFAPHVMLFKRRLHTSIIHRSSRFRPNVPARFLDHPGILIDKGSRRSIDMSYVQAADIYLGDVSSQIYEWIQRPRPAIFFNTHMPQWQRAADYRHWALGNVIKGVDAMPSAIARALANPDVYSSRQQIADTETFSRTDKPAGTRAAEAVLDYLRAFDSPAEDTTNADVALLRRGPGANAGAGAYAHPKSG